MIAWPYREVCLITDTKSKQAVLPNDPYHLVYVAMVKVKGFLINVFS